MAAAARPNAEAVNDRAKLIMHRLAARVLARDGALLGQAHARQARLRAEGRDNRDTATWDAMLAWPAERLRRRVIQRDEAMVALRSTSPLLAALPYLRNEAVRRRIWRKARLGA